MAIYGVGRATATSMLNKYLGKARIKGKKYVVSRENFDMWVKNGGFKK